MEWHQKDIQRIIEELTTSLHGLSPAEAQERLLRHGPNELKDTGRLHPLVVFLAQFKNFMIMILLAAAIVSGLVGELSDTIVIVAIVIINGIIGFVQEYRAEKALASLKKLAAPVATVVRDGLRSAVDASILVPGDIVVVEAGEVVPADMRVAEASHLRVEEAALTGESIPVEKRAEAITEPHLPLGDRINMMYAGTYVTYGRGLGIVVSTGMDTEFGRIASMLVRQEAVRTPLERRLNVFSRWLAVIVLFIAALIFAVGVVRGESLLLMLLTSISLAVAAIPEALPAVVTIALALSARSMVKQNALMRKLPAVETLGSVTYICSDKTGTLTQNRMVVTQVFVDGKVSDPAEWKIDEDDLFLVALAISNDACVDAKGGLVGDPTETALLSLAEGKGFPKRELEGKYPRIEEIPFDSGRKLMTTFHLWQGGCISITKGAVDAIIERSTRMRNGSEAVDLDAGAINQVNQLMTDRGLRVLGFAFRFWQGLPSNISSDTVERQMTVLGLVAMVDPPRKEARAAVAECKEAGLKPVMITGDHPLTAKTIARQLGIAEDESVTLTGADLESLSDRDFTEVADRVRVYARVAPEQKLRIITALQGRGHIVAMTGDGVNDAPALKQADIGIAMGVTGTDVAREAGDMILLDDNFATIVRAIRHGRRIYDNIRKSIRYLLTTNSGEIWTLLLAPFLGLPIPLLPIHILWINLLTDGLPALALSAEGEEEDVMRRPPRDPREGVLGRGLGIYALWMGLLMAAVALSTEVWFEEGSEWQTMVFTVLCLSQLGNVLTIRSEKSSLFAIGLFSNKPLLGAVCVTFVLQMAVIYIPFFNSVFKTVPLTFYHLLLTLLLSSIIFFTGECEKLVRRGFLFRKC